MELIDRQALIKFIDVGHLRNPLELCFSEKSVVDMLESRPTVDAVPVVHGRWLEGSSRQPCSVCRYRGMRSWNYCPNCGAKMDGDKSCRNCANCEYLDDGERKITDTCAKCNWVKRGEDKEPSNWKPANDGLAVPYV